MKERARAGAMLRGLIWRMAGEERLDSWLTGGEHAAASLV